MQQTPPTTTVKPNWVKARITLTWTIKTIRKGVARPAKPQVISNYQEVLTYQDTASFTSEDGKTTTNAPLTDDKAIPGCRFVAFPTKGTLTITQIFTVQFPKNVVGTNIQQRLSPQNFQKLLSVYNAVIARKMEYKHLDTKENVTDVTTMWKRGFADCGGLVKIFTEKANATGLEITPVSGISLDKQGEPTYHVAALVRDSRGEFFLVDPVRLHAGFSGSGFDEAYPLLANNPVMRNFYTEKGDLIVDGAGVSHTQIPPAWGYEKTTGNIKFEFLP
jgi:hypothetical protein